MEDIENLVIIWIGSAPEEFQSTFIFTKQFHSIHSYEDYMKTSGKNNRIYLILDNTSNTDISPLVNYPQIISFYLFNTKSNIDHKKMRGSFKGNTSLFQKIHNDIRSYYRNFSAPWGVFDWPTTQTSLNELSDDNDNVLFVWGQILLDILYKLPSSDDEQAKEEWLSECRRVYANDKSTIGIERINKFEREYCSDDATKWYSDNGFAYRLLNQALRTKNIDIIYKCRFMLREIYQQLVKLQKDQRKNEIFITTVYRGQEITEKELEKLRRNKEQLISTNTFLSTSIDSEVAKWFLDNDARSSSDKHWIIFTITVEPEVSLPSIFAYIGEKKLTTKPDEMEVLFAPGAVFRTETVPIQAEKDHIWRMNLHLAQNDQCLELNKFIDEIQKKHSHSPNSLYTLASVLAEMGQTNSALLFYRMLIQQSSYNNKLPEYDLLALFSNIGSLWFDIGNYYEAIRFYEKVINLIRTCYPFDVFCWVRVLSHMGSTYMELGNYKRARYFLDCALLYIEYFPQQRFDIHAHLYNNMGRLEQNEKNFDTSLTYFKKSIDIIDNHLPDEKKYLISVRLNIASVYQEQENYDLAIEKYEQIIKICEKTLPSENTPLIKTYSSMSLCYSNQGKFDKAHDYIKKSIKLAVAQKPLNYDIMATCYNVYAVYYDSKKEYVQALEQAKLSLEYAKQANLSNDHPVMELYQKVFEDIKTSIENV